MAPGLPSLHLSHCRNSDSLPTISKHLSHYSLPQQCQNVLEKPAEEKDCLKMASNQLPSGDCTRNRALLALPALCKVTVVTGHRAHGILEPFVTISTQLARSASPRLGLCKSTLKKQNSLLNSCSPLGSRMSAHIESQNIPNCSLQCCSCLIQ